MINFSLTRRFTGFLCVFLGTALISSLAKAEPTDPPKPLNLLIIQTDEHNFRTLGCYRDTLPKDQAFIWGLGAIVETPAIDSIANRGAICTSFYATSPVCTPSRASFFTGRYPQNTGSPQNDRPLDNDQITFAEVLRQAGYATGYAGKWHLDGPGKPQWGPKRQFGFVDNRFMFNRGHWKKFELTSDGPKVAATNRKGEPTYGLADADASSFSTDWLTDRAMDFIRQHSGQPFCYHLSLPDPHGPNTVRPPYDQMFLDMPVRPPRTFQMSQENPGWAPATGKNVVRKFNPALMQQYFGMVRCIDDNVAKLLALLEELQILSQTVVVVTSDHGDLCFEHGRLNKGNPYEGSAKIPMIIAAPGVIAPRTRVDNALGTVDFAATILNLLGQEVPKQVQGRDASWLLLKRSEPADWNDVTFLRAASAKPSWVAAVTDQYKLVISTSDSPWLFDLAIDPDELANQFDRPVNRSIIKQLAKQLLDYGDRYDDEQIKANQIRSQLLQIADGMGEN
ncbi:MAG: sulfatase-like hydrolase/transferase [Planctomycetota bacterium]